MTGRPPVWAQENPGGQTIQEQSDTFSGTVIELKSDRLSVRRAIARTSVENKAFLIQPDTRVEGKLRLKARVTVRFVTNEAGEAVAMLIVVRQTTSKKP